jgi:O-antigen/teichoic acid export membrane protein
MTLFNNNMKNSNSRTSNIIRSTVYGIGGYIVTYLFSFITRTVFILTLGQIYLGVQGLFSSILSFLALTELGLGSAIMFSLYKPIADNDTEKIKSLMEYYKKAYRIIGLLVLVFGLILIPFLDFFINEPLDIPESLEIIYLLYLLNSVLSYFLIYKQSLIRAYQKTHIVSLYTNIFTIVRDITQIVCLLTFKSFIPTLIIIVFFTFISNVALSLKADKMYPYAKNTKGYKLDKHTRIDITTKIKSMFLYRIGAYVVIGTDNILISKFFGVIYVGLYSNYYILIALVKTLTGFFTTAVTPSLGNIISTSDVKSVRKVFEELNFMIFWLYSFCSVCLYILLNPFITIWLGNDYLLSENIVILIVINFYIYGIHQNMLIFRNALGLYVQAKWKPIAEAIVNLIASLILIDYFGLAGVFLGTMVSFLTTALWIEPVVLFKHYLGKGVSKYFVEYIYFALTTVISSIIIKYITDTINNHSILTWVVKLIICLIVHNLIIIIIYRKTNAYKDCLRRFNKTILNFRK